MSAGRELCYGLIASRHPACRGSQSVGLISTPIKMTFHAARGIWSQANKGKTACNKSVNTNKVQCYEHLCCRFPLQTALFAPFLFFFPLVATSELLFLVCIRVLCVSFFRLTSRCCCCRDVGTILVILCTVVITVPAAGSRSL